MNGIERAGVARSVAMKLTGHRTESVYRRYAIFSESNLANAVGRIALFYAAAPKIMPKVLPLPQTASR